MDIDLVGLWTELKTLGERVMLLTRAVAQPIWYDLTANALRATITSGTVTTVSTLSNISQVGGVDAKTGYADLIMRANWSEGIRRRIN